MKQLTIVGAGWAGLAAAVAATQHGWHVQLYEATHQAGGRARSLTQTFAEQPLDNGQHVLIGAYKDTLALMRTVGIQPDTVLLRLPLDLRFADNTGLALSKWPAPLNVLLGLASAQGWSFSDKCSFLKAAVRWQQANFVCPPHWTVTQLCDADRLSARVRTQLIDPLCLSALNTQMTHASAEQFLRVLHDALYGPKGSSDLLIPRVDLGSVLPDACVRWLRDHGAQVHLGRRVSAAQLENRQAATDPDTPVLLACPAWEAARLVANVAPAWASQCRALSHHAIATVYLRCRDAGFETLARPMIALHSSPHAPAQFIFDKGLLNQQYGLLAAVVSACDADRHVLTQQVRHQVCDQLNLTDVEVVQTVVEKRATLACTPLLQRPKPEIAPNLWACGDYLYAPYPSTLESAVRSGQEVFAQIDQTRHR